MTRWRGGGGAFATGRSRRRGRRSAAGALAAAVLAALPLFAHAEQADDEIRARQLFERGMEARRRGDLVRSVEAFSESYRLFPRPGTLYNLAIDCDESVRAAEASSSQ